MTHEKFERAAKLFHKIDEYENVLNSFDSNATHIKGYDLVDFVVENKDVKDVLIGHLKFKIKLWKEEFESL